MTRQKNPDWEWDNRNKTPLGTLAPAEEPEYIFLNWKGWGEATLAYNGGGVADYGDRVNGPLHEGTHSNAAAGQDKLWPILTNGEARQ